MTNCGSLLKMYLCDRKKYPSIKQTKWLLWYTSHQKANFENSRFHLHHFLIFKFVNLKYWFIKVQEIISFFYLQNKQVYQSVFKFFSINIKNVTLLSMKSIDLFSGLHKGLNCLFRLAPECLFKNLRFISLPRQCLL